MSYDLVIKQGMIVDGAGNPWYRGDMGIRNGKIARIGHIATSSSSNTIQASGMFVAPGFVDMHTHSDLTLLVNPKAESYVRQGVTTEVIGNCGFSAAPLGDSQREIHCFGPKPIVDASWHSFGEYLDRLQGAQLSQNIVPLVGHGAIRLMVMGYDARPARRDEIQDMKSMVASAMKEGAFGLSSGLEYAPGINADTTELIELCKTVSEYRGVFVCHVRDRGKKLVESIHEVLDIGRQCGIPVHISHIWPKWPHADKGK